MNKKRLGVAALALLLLLALVMALGGSFPGGTPATDNTAEALLEAVMSRLGVAWLGEALAWLETPGDTPEGETLARADASVWVTRHGGTYHSYPLCGWMKAPLAMTLAGAEALGYLPCGKCWAHQLPEEW